MKEMITIQNGELCMTFGPQFFPTVSQNVTRILDMGLLCGQDLSDDLLEWCESREREHRDYVQACDQEQEEIFDEIEDLRIQRTAARTTLRDLKKQEDCTGEKALRLKIEQLSGAIAELREKRTALTRERNRNGGVIRQIERNRGRITEWQQKWQRRS